MLEKNKYPKNIFFCRPIHFKNIYVFKQVLLKAVEHCFGV